MVKDWTYHVIYWCVDRITNKMQQLLSRAWWSTTLALSFFYRFDAEMKSIDSKMRDDSVIKL